MSMDIAGVDAGVIAVDIDGTVASVNADYSACEVLPGARESLLRMKEMGYRVYLHTGRHINNHEVTVKWLAANAIPYDMVVFGKPPARYYIDDRAIAFTDWDSAMAQVEVPAAKNGGGA